MTGLETAFYIMGIVFMSVIFLLTIGIFVAVLVIRSKINKIHDNIERKIDSITTIAERGGEISAMASSEIINQIKKAFRKATK